MALLALIASLESPESRLLGVRPLVVPRQTTLAGQVPIR